MNKLMLPLAIAASLAWGCGASFPPPTQRMADEMTGCGLRPVENGQHFIGHVGDAVARRQLRRAGPAGARLIVGDDAIARLQRFELRGPISGRPAEAGREQNGLGVRTLMDVDGHFLPIWATVAISISASFFTRPH